MLRITQIPITGSKPTQGITSSHPALPPVSSNTFRNQQAADQIHFGAIGPDPDMPFRQIGSNYTGTQAQPVSPNNCQVASAKNLLVYYGFSPRTVDNCLQTRLTTEASDSENEDEFSPTYPHIDHRGKTNPNKIELNQNFVLECLTNPHGLQMDIDPYRRKGKAEIKKAIDEGLSFMVFAKNGPGNDTHTLAASGPNQGHDLGDEHAYTVIPDRANPGQWKVLDSLKERPTGLNADELKRNLDTMKSENSVYCIVRNGPNRASVEIYNPDAKNNNTDSTTPVEPQPATSSNVSPPIKDKKPSSSFHKNAKKGIFSRMGDWFKRQWNKLKDVSKRFWQWLKKPFRSKSK
jgi:hypothetical protein